MYLWASAGEEINTDCREMENEAANAREMSELEIESEIKGTLRKDERERERERTKGNGGRIERARHKEEEETRYRQNS